MRVLLAFDKFKHAIPARTACTVAATAVQYAHPDWDVDLCPLTDGGDGFGEILTTAAGGEMHSVRVTGPRGRPVDARVGMVPFERVPAAVRRRLELPAAPPSGTPVAILELAAASGLALLPPDEQDPWQTTTTGTGELIAAARQLGCAAVLLGLGGSATNDLALGALAALGMEFLSGTGTVLHPPVPAAWERIERIRGAVIPDLPPLRLACDVTNPLLGPHGCAATFGPQKGLGPADVPRMDQADARIALMLCTHCGRPDDLIDTPGAGAAGGTAFGLMVGAGARLVNGSSLVAEWLDLDQRIAAADVVLTGEGSFDRSSLAGKGPGAVVARAAALGKPVHVFAGRVEAGLGSAAHLHAITPPGLSTAGALPATAGLLHAAVRTVFS